MNTREEEEKMSGEAQAQAPNTVPIHVPIPEAIQVPIPAPYERLNFNVSHAVADEVRSMASELHMSMSQLFRYAFSILKIAMEEKRKNRKLVIADQDGAPLREIVLPS